MQKVKVSIDRQMNSIAVACVKSQIGNKSQFSNWLMLLNKLYVMWAKIAMCGI